MRVSHLIHAPKAMLYKVAVDLSDSNVFHLTMVKCCCCVNLFLTCGKKKKIWGSSSPLALTRLHELQRRTDVFHQPYSGSEFPRCLQKDVATF